MDWEAELAAFGRGNPESGIQNPKSKIQNPKSKISKNPHILLIGQTPPPWHGQAVATQLLFEHDWQDFEVHRLRMAFSHEMEEVGRFRIRKIWLLLKMTLDALRILRAHPGTVLFYPPASAKWIPFLRDVFFLSITRRFAGSTVFIFHASGLGAFFRASPLREFMGRIAYAGADFHLEVAQEQKDAPHEVFGAKGYKWCPCAIEVPGGERIRREAGRPWTALFVGSLQEGKGVLEILRTAAALKAMGHGADFKFRVVGKWFSSSFEAETRALRAELGVEDTVDLVGQLTGDDKWQEYREADVFFFPTHYSSEATPIVLMEALGMGLPLLTTQWAGIPAMLEGCGSAEILPVRSPGLYAKYLLEQWEGRDSQESPAMESVRFYKARFLPEAFIDRVAEGWRLSIGNGGVRSISASLPKPIKLRVYLADQNPGYDRSFGISRMSRSILEALAEKKEIRIEAVVSKTSQRAPESTPDVAMIPWGTRTRWIRLLTDHLHPAILAAKREPDVFYFPKGYLPLLSAYCQPSIVTIHDTIIQYDEDHYPEWRHAWEYAYWARNLKHTLRYASRILTVSQSSKRQIEDFMERHGIPAKPITVTYEPCAYEPFPQPFAPQKENFVVHLASKEPHKRTGQLIRWWLDAEKQNRKLPQLHLIGIIAKSLASEVEASRSIVKRPFLADEELREVYAAAKALVLPSEIEGFGLPALEAFYSGTPVCFVKGTSVAEILSVATSAGGYALDDAEGFFKALDNVMTMDAEEVRRCGLILRETYAAEKVADRMVGIFREVAGVDFG